MHVEVLQRVPRTYPVDLAGAVEDELADGIHVGMIVTSDLPVKTLDAPGRGFFLPRLCSLEDELVPFSRVCLMSLVE